MKKIIKNKKWFIDRIKGFVLHMTSYDGEWCHGFHHKYQIHIQDVIPDFVIFELHVDDSELSFFGYNLKTKQEMYLHDVEEHILTRKIAKKIYYFLKSIDIFEYIEYNGKA